MDITSAAFWAALGSIVVANILLSGDNAVVIAMAARSLPPPHQRRAIAWGSAAAIALRIVLTVVAAELLKLPYLKIVGALLLFYIGVTLLADDDAGEDGHTGRPTAGGLIVAIRTILIADLVMSLDNVIAVAAAAKGNIALLVIGLAISIPLIVFGSTMLVKVMERLPVIITGGAALLGWLAGEMLASDPGLPGLVGEVPSAAVTAAGVIGAGLVVATGSFLQRRAADVARR